MSNNELREVSVASARAKVEALGFAVPEQVALLHENSTLQPLQAIAERALGTCLAAVCGEGLPASDTLIIATNWGIQHVFTEEEAAFLATVRPTDEDRTRFVWRYEGLVMLLWTLGFHEELPPDHEICDTGAQAAIIIQHQNRLSANSALRPAAVLRAWADYYAYLHAALTHACLEDPAHPQAHAWVVRERWHMLQWLWSA